MDALKKPVEVEQLGLLDGESMSEDQDFEARVRCGIPVAVIRSWLQKAVRRNEERDAMFCVATLYDSNFHKYVWRTLAIIAAEDVAGGDPNAITQFMSWYNAGLLSVSHLSSSEKLKPPLMFATGATMWLCRANKNRDAADAAWLSTQWVLDGYTPTVPDYAYDMHTKLGKMAGKGVEEFTRVGRVVSPEVAPRWKRALYDYTGYENLPDVELPDGIEHIESPEGFEVSKKPIK